ncbi:MAG TPA: hypothetical protein VHV83_21150 [Armatimonadota bacterium]|nr:hypothetical protein [Armatimonadota bacterium]
MRVTILLAAFLICSVAGYCITDTVAGKKLAELFPVNSTQRIEIMYPDEGFVGSPESPSPLPSIRIPKTADDYVKRYVSVAVISQRLLPDGQRIVLRLDETGQDGKVTISGLYFVYLDVRGAKIDVLCKFTDDNNAVQDTGIKHGLPFPLAYAIPPELMSSVYKSVDGYLDNRNHGALFSRTVAVADEPAAIHTTITTFQHTKEGLCITAKETQTWKADDWLWTDMQRVDRHGHLIMSCKRLPANQ